jgi:hypothetical protein
VLEVLPDRLVPVAAQKYTTPRNQITEYLENWKHCIRRNAIRMKPKSCTPSKVVGSSIPNRFRGDAEASANTVLHLRVCHMELQRLKPRWSFLCGREVHARSPRAVCTCTK